MCAVRRAPPAGKNVLQCKQIIEIQASLARYLWLPFILSLMSQPLCLCISMLTGSDDPVHSSAVFSSYAVSL